MNIFLSYAEADKAWAKTFKTELAKSGFEVRGSLDEIDAGTNLHLQAGKALKQSDAMIVLVSPQSVDSPYVRSEIDYALSSPQFRDRLISVVVEPTKDVPWILRHLNLIHASKKKDDTVRDVVAALRKTPAAAVR